MWGGYFNKSGLFYADSYYKIILIYFKIKQNIIISLIGFKYKRCCFFCDFKTFPKHAEVLSLLTSFPYITMT